jgi:hypothetical protein
MLGLGLRYPRIGIGIVICWDRDRDMLLLELGYDRIGIRICWDKDWNMLGLGLGYAGIWIWIN